MKTRQAQAAAIGAWGQSRGERFARLRQIKQPALVFNGNDDIMIPTRNSFLLSQYLQNALLIYQSARPNEMDWTAGRTPEL